MRGARWSEGDVPPLKIGDRSIPGLRPVALGYDTEAMWTAVRALLVVSCLLAADVALAQFVPKTHCGAAFPCSIPYGVQYNPDPLVLGPYAAPANSAISFRTTLDARPTITIDIRPRDNTPIDAAVRTFLQQYPATPKPPAPPADAEKTDPKPPPPEPKN
jgi:hypothetical protein